VKRENRTEVARGGRQIVESDPGRNQLVGNEAVHGKPGPHRVVVRDRPEQDPGARCEVAPRHVDPGRCEASERVLEPCDLAGREIGETGERRASRAA
jgi:hypothetical protein